MEGKYMAWYDDEARLFSEEKAIREQFPQFEWGTEPDRCLSLSGAMRSNRGNYFALKLVYPSNYPLDVPKVYCTGAEINGIWYNELPWFDKSRTHMYSQSHICWIDVPRSNSWDPRKSTAVVTLTTVAVWLFCYEAYVFDGERWLGSDH